MSTTIRINEPPMTLTGLKPPGMGLNTPFKLSSRYNLYCCNNKKLVLDGAFCRSNRAALPHAAKV